MTVTIHHKADCANPDAAATVTGDKGDKLLRCDRNNGGCGRFKVLEIKVPQPPKPAPVVDTPQAAAMREQATLERAAAPEPDPEPVVARPTHAARYALDCVACERTLRLHRSTPVVPLCRDCQGKREARKVGKAKARAQGAQDRAEGVAA